MAELFLGPDLENGYMINAYDGKNRWLTSIVCALEKVGPDGQGEWSYLSNECRSEYLYHLKNVIFKDRPYEFRILQSWSGCLVIRSGPWLYGFSRKANRRLRLSGEHLERPKRLAPFVFDSKVVYSNTKTLALDFNQLSKELIEKPLGHHSRLFMRMQWAEPPDSYNLFAPCNYINFPNPHKNDHHYIQFQTGPVLFVEQQRFFIAYVAAYINHAGCQRIEFCLRDIVSFLSLKKKGGRLHRLLDIADRWLLQDYAVQEAFTRRVAVDGSCDLFRYVH